MKPLNLAASACGVAVIFFSHQLMADLILVNPTGQMDVNVGAFEDDGTGLMFLGSGMNVPGFDNSKTVVAVMTDFPGLVNGMGQASIDAATRNEAGITDGFSSIMFMPAGGFHGFGAFEFNPAGTGSFTVTAIDNNGTEFFFDLNLSNGQNRFRIEGIDGQTISKVSVTANNGSSRISSIRQVRLDQLIMPEPSSMFLLLSGTASALGVTVFSRRRKNLSV